MAYAMIRTSILLLAALDAYARAAAVPAPAATGDLHAAQRPIHVAAPLITPSPSLNEATRTHLDRRGLLDDIHSRVDSALTALGSNIPSYVASGMLQRHWPLLIANHKPQALPISSRTSHPGLLSRAPSD